MSTLMKKGQIMTDQCMKKTCMVSLSVIFVAKPDMMIADLTTLLDGDGNHVCYPRLTHGNM